MLLRTVSAITVAASLCFASLAGATPRQGPAASAATPAHRHLAKPQHAKHLHHLPSHIKGQGRFGARVHRGPLHHHLVHEACR